MTRKRQRVPREWMMAEIAVLLMCGGFAFIALVHLIRDLI